MNEFACSLCLMSFWPQAISTIRLRRIDHILPQKTTSFQHRINPLIAAISYYEGRGKGRKHRQNPQRPVMRTGVKYRKCLETRSEPSTSQCSGDHRAPLRQCRWYRAEVISPFYFIVYQLTAVDCTSLTNFRRSHVFTNIRFSWPAICDLLQKFVEISFKNTRWI